MKKLLSMSIIALSILCFVNNLLGVNLFSDKTDKCYNGINLINETDHEINIFFKNDNVEINNHVLFYGNMEKPSGYTLSSHSSFNTFDSKNISSSLYLGMGGTGGVSLASDFGTKTNPSMISIIVKLCDLNNITDNTQISFFAIPDQSNTVVCAEMKNAKDSVNIFKNTINVSIEPSSFTQALDMDSMTINYYNLFTIKFSQLKPYPATNAEPPIQENNNPVKTKKQLNQPV